MKTHAFILVFLLLPVLNFSQKVSGNVTNKEGSPLDQVEIYNANFSTHTYSDLSGRYELSNMAIGDTIIFSHLGYSNDSLIVRSLEDELNIVLTAESLNIEQIVIASSENPLSVISDIDVQIKPVNSAQEVLRKVPGLFIGQHAGGGKAEQIFLRGFDIDHGTDISISVDGLPVNMVSHAHGQGYADLHFLIPETIYKIDFGKGAYYKNVGNFNTAGYVNFETRKKLENNTLKLEAGQFNTRRLMGMFKLLDHANHHAYLASEYIVSDGPFESSQDFSRNNFFLKYAYQPSATDYLELSTSYFTSTWDASGQIPQRAVDQGLITRFGAIDDTEGGNTSRTNVSLKYHRTFDDLSTLRNLIYLSLYDFELFSNFTFYLEDPINGDQIRQVEDRRFFGLQSEYNRIFSLADFQGNFSTGITLRSDQVENNELSSTLNRTITLNQIQFGDVIETNFGAFIGSSLEIGRWYFTPSIRYDVFRFGYQDLLSSTSNSQETTKGIISPKLSVNYRANNSLQFYAKAGKGFHSNDSRVVLDQSSQKILPASLGYDVGILWKPVPNTVINLAAWYLFLEQEFVYVGDAGIVEPSGKTRRRGLDLSGRYQPLDWLYLDLDATWSNAMGLNDQEEYVDFIPLAPNFTCTSGLNIKLNSGLFGNLSFRHLGDRPANKDNSIVAQGYSITDLSMGYNWNKLSLSFQIQNLFDTEWNETQFATESRLANELEPVEEIHFTPGTPFFIKAIAQYNF